MAELPDPTPVVPVTIVSGTGDGKNNTLGWFVFTAAIGMALGLLGSEIAALPTFAAVASPAFVGKAFVHLSTVIAAFVGGKIIQTN